MMEFEGRAYYPLDFKCLPTGWSAAFVGDLCIEVQSGFASGEHNAEGKGIAHLRPMNVDREGRLDLSVIKYVARDVDQRRLRPGDVLFNNTNSPVLVGKTAAVSTDAELAFSNHMTRLTPARGIDHRYLAHHLHYLWMGGFFFRRCNNHVNQASVSSDTVACTIPVAVPPSSEQSLIVEAIDSTLSRLDAAVANLDRAQAKLKAYRASVLKAAVEGRLVPTEAELARKEKRTYEPADTLLARILKERRRRWEDAELAKLKAAGKTPKDDKWKDKYEEPEPPNTSQLPVPAEGWCWATVDMLALVKGGVTKGQARASGEVLLKVPYLRVANVQRGYLNLAEVKTIQATPSEVEELRLEPGDVLFNEGGDRDKLGRGWVWSGEIDGCIHQNHVFRARILTRDLRPRFLSWYGNSSGQRYFFDEGKQTTNLASINMTKLKALPVPIPPLAEQDRIADEVERLLSIADECTGTVTREVRRSARLRQSVLKWAFEGKLVDQDPNDEPAEELLARIRAERAAARPTKNLPGPKAKTAT